jgi:hypothetical protein
MLELGIAQAQANFTKILDEQTVIVDKKNKTKRAVILPYEMYTKLLKQIQEKEIEIKGSFSQFRGLLSKDFKTDDDRYNHIVNSGT